MILWWFLSLLRWLRQLASEATFNRRYLRLRCRLRTPLRQIVTPHVSEHATYFGGGGREAVVLDIVLFVSVTPIYEFDVTETNSPVSRTKGFQKNRWRVLQHEARLFAAGEFF